MEYMELGAFIRYGTPVLLLALIIVNVYQSTILRMLVKKLEKFAETVVYRDTCEAHRSEIEHRLRVLERRANGAKQ